MMLFQNTKDHPHIFQILCGDKTETRRQAKRWVMKVGGEYPVHDASKGLFQKREDAACFIKCTARWEEKLGNLTEESACREGLYSPVRFWDVWKELNGLCDLNEVVKVYQFEFIKYSTPASWMTPEGK